MRNSQRRKFLKDAAGLVLACWTSSGQAGARPARGILPNPVGYAAISWPDKEFDQALRTTSELGYQGVQMLGWVRDTYAGKEDELKERLSALKLELVALSCSKVHLKPDDPADFADELRGYAQFAQRLGGHYLQITDSGRPDANYSEEQVKSLAQRMNALGKIARDHGLQLGYHPHVNTLGESREGMGRILGATDPKLVGLIVDVAHLALAGVDPAEVIRAYRRRLLFFHFKDVRKDAAGQARSDLDQVRRAKVRFCEIGKGTVDYPAVLKAIRDAHFKGWIIVELDAYQVPAGGPAESARINKEALQKLGFRV